MKMILVSKHFLDIEQYVEFKMSVLIFPSKSLISLRWVTYVEVSSEVIHLKYILPLKKTFPNSSTGGV